MKFFFLFTSITILHIVLSQNDCLPARCGPSGPLIRFPFRLTDHQPAHCGYPGFELSCTTNNFTKLDLRFPVTASAANVTIPLQTTVSVYNIDYSSQTMLAGNAVAKSCLPEKHALATNLNLKSTDVRAFEVEALGYNEGYTLFNCTNARGFGGEKIDCLSRRGSYEVIALASIYDVTSLPMYSSCFKMYDISFVPDGMFSGRDDEYRTRIYLRWREPSCGDSCFSHEQHRRNQGASRSHKPLAAGIITAGTLILLLITIASSYFILRSTKQQREHGKVMDKILQNHKDNMRPVQYSYADIKKITHNFKDATFGSTSHNGKLVDGTRVVVKTVDCSKHDVEEFISEVAIIGRMQHENVLQLTGYCVDRRKSALVYEFSQNGTLENITPPDDHRILHWIALGMAKGINYAQHESAGKILKLDDVTPRTVILDENFNPKIMLLPTASIDHPSASPYDAVLKKAEVFSFGMLLLGILGRMRDSFHGGEREKSRVNFPEWIYKEMSRGGGENEMVKKISVVGLWCIQWFPSDRPSMECVVEMLQGDKVPIMPPNPFPSF